MWQYGTFNEYGPVTDHFSVIIYTVYCVVVYFVWLCTLCTELKYTANVQSLRTLWKLYTISYFQFLTPSWSIKP